jgi:hypothetical protein
MSDNTIFNPAPGWYKGDFHAHTHFSDGVHSPEDLVELARAEGLDFLSITDHNVVGGWEALASPLPLPVIRGVEVTLASGHFNVLGLTERPSWIDELTPVSPERQWTADYPAVNELMQTCVEAGWLVSINHPLLEPWAWLNMDTLLERVVCLEIWNDPTWPDNATANPQAVALWTEWLNAGHRITAIGGTDYHYPVTEEGDYDPRLSLPRTYVYADSLSADAILEGVRKRRAYVTMGPTLAFHAEWEGTTRGIGDDLGAASGDVNFQTRMAGDGDAVLQLCKNGKPVASQRAVEGVAELRHVVSADPEEPAWFHCHVLDGEGRFLAVSNPIFSGPVLEPQMLTYGESNFVPSASASGSAPGGP